MFTRVVKDGNVWVESTEGFKVATCMSNGNSSCVIYEVVDRQIILEAEFWHDSKKDQEADVTKMTARQLDQYIDRMMMLIYVPEVLRWEKSQEAIAEKDRIRILGDLRGALEFGNHKPRFVKSK
jgi:hypothetical protein